MAAMAAAACVFTGLALLAQVQVARTEQLITVEAAPANPPAGTILLWADSTSLNLSCKTSAGANCLPTGGGSGTVTSVGLSLPAIFTVTGSPVTTSGTLTGTLNSQNANLVFAGPSSGAAAAPSFRALVGADLPNPAPTALGGIESFAAVAHQWINTISTAGVPSATQPNFTDLSGSIAIGQTPLTTQGDLLFANATPALARLAIGTNTQCLTSNGTTVVWSVACGTLSGTVAGSTTSLAARTCGDAVTATITGATTSMTATVSPQIISTNLMVFAWPSSANTVTVEFCNMTSASITPAATTFQIRVIE